MEIPKLKYSILNLHISRRYALLSGKNNNILDLKITEHTQIGFKM